MLGQEGEIMDSNTSLSSMLTPKFFKLFLRSVLRDRIWPALAFQAGFLVQSCDRAT